MKLLCILKLISLSRGVSCGTYSYVEPVEYGCWVHVGHVNVMLFILFSFALGSQRECGFWYNMGLMNCNFSKIILYSDYIFETSGPGLQGVPTYYSEYRIHPKSGMGKIIFIFSSQQF